MYAAMLPEIPALPDYNPCSISGVWLRDAGNWRDTHPPIRVSAIAPYRRPVRFSVTHHKHDSPTYELHILELLERTKQAVSQAQGQIAVSQKLHRDSDEILAKIDVSHQVYRKWRFAVTTRP